MGPFTLNLKAKLVPKYRLRKLFCVVEVYFSHYEKLYRTYDPEPDYKRMRDLGLLQSASPGDDF